MIHTLIHQFGVFVWKKKAWEGGGSERGNQRQMKKGGWKKDGERG